jgi:hypothetical protein
MTASHALSLSLSVFYGVLISFGALACGELIAKQLGIGDPRNQMAHASLQARWFYTILFFVALCAAVYLPQAMGFGNSTVYSVSGVLSFFPLYFLFVRRWRRKGWVTPWAVEKKKLKRDSTQYLLAFAIILTLFVFTVLRRRWGLLHPR